MQFALEYIHGLYEGMNISVVEINPKTKPYF